ncbi:hypothetical protein [Microcoleus sp. bin38.metabat.b11b12b14.051]|uniref:hypothetical protein n=1 Tax=Microcoleus sp. bin38.metabat.b11b12b14.051 TaxID=2742709 RepID=UPI0025F003F9|nr:hypothetical protein [Microcoleus sp. bin38.metabat.b11b12b14.051]
MPHFLLVILTGWSTVQVCTGLILGSVERLNLPELIIAEIVIFAIGTIPTFAQKNRAFSFRHWQVPQLKQPLSPWELLIVGSAAFAGFVLWDTLTTKPTTNYDSLWFHLPAIARWYQTHSFTLLDAAGDWIFEQEQARVYPYNWHVLSALCILPFREDFVAAFPLLIAWVIEGIAVYLLSVKFGASRIHAMAASSLVLTVPMVLNQVNTIHPDLPLAAVFTASLYFGLSYCSSRATSELSLFLATVGMLAGIKITGLIYAASLVGGLAILEIQRFAIREQNYAATNQNLPTASVPRARHRQQLTAILRTSNNFLRASGNFRIRHLKPVLLGGIACCLLLGGFWYTRNLLHVNYPVGDSREIKVPLQPVPLPSPIPSPIPPVPAPTPPVQQPTPTIPAPPVAPSFRIWQSTLAAQFNPRNLAHWQTLGWQIIVRLQLPFIAIALQALAAPVAVFQGKTKISKQNNIILLVLLAGTGILYLVTPYTSGTGGESIGQISPLLGFNLRYGFPFLNLLGVAAAATATKLKTANQVVVAVVLISSISGIVSSTIFDIIKKASFSGTSIIWGSGLIDTFKSNFGAALSQTTKILAPSWQYLGIYPLIYIGLLVLAGIWFQHNLSLMRLKNSLARLKKSSKIAIVCICIVLMVSASWVAREKRDLARAELYRNIYEYIDRHTAPNERIGFSLSSRSYLFYGKNLDRQVLYVPFRADRLSAWIDNLKKQKISTVGFGPLTETDYYTKQALSWLTSPEGPLQPVFGKDFHTESVLYRLKN